MPGIKAFVAAVFGGIGSIPGAFIGGRGAAFGRKVVSLPAFRPRGAASVRITAKLRIMEKEENKYVAVAYELYTTDENGAAELVEKAPAEHPPGVGHDLGQIKLHGMTAESQVSATEESKKISAGDFQPRHFLGRELIRSTTF